MKIVICVFSFLFMFFLSHSNTDKFGQPDVDVSKLEKSFSDWWKYHNQNIRLSSYFIALDNSEKRISKQSFLEKLNGGEFIPIKLTSPDSTCYKLYRLDKTADKTIPEVIKYAGSEALKNFEKEGKPFPIFSFKDLNGVEYNNAKLKGKILVIKCWFIACAPCLEEIPELNNLVEKYTNREDVVFIGLAYDSKKALDAFLLQRPFRYILIPDQRKYVFNDLDVKSYPTHFVIDKDGVIRKVVNTIDELTVALEKIVVLYGDKHIAKPN